MNENKYLTLIKVINTSIDEISQEIKELVTVLDCLVLPEEEELGSDVIVHTRRSIQLCAKELDDIMRTIDELGVIH